MLNRDKKASIRRRYTGFFLTAGALLLSAALIVGCSRGTALGAQPGTAANQAQATQTTLLAGAPTATDAAQAVTATTVLTPPVAADASPTTAGIATASTLRPTPTGAVAAPNEALNVYNFFGSGNTLVRKDFVQLDGAGNDETLFTITGPDPSITTENRSLVNVLLFDTTYQEWQYAWSSQPVSGTAIPLLGANSSGLGGINGGDLLRTGSPILMLRTTTKDGRAHLYLYRWNAASKQGEPLKMVTTKGGAEREAVFDADLDINMADLNGDGVYEVVADNAAGVQVWRWDGQKYVPEEQR